MIRDGFYYSVFERTNEVYFLGPIPHMKGCVHFTNLTYVYFHVIELKKVCHINIQNVKRYKQIKKNLRRRKENVILTPCSI